MFELQETDAAGADERAADLPAGAESKDARYHKLIRWIVSAFIFCMLMMSAIFIYAWTSYDYVGEDIEVDGGQNGIANYIGDRGVIFNGENNGSAEISD